jgi:hypothetical protein
LVFFIDPSWAEGVNLLVSPRGRDAFLQHAHSLNDCTVVLGCHDQLCADQVSVDKGPVRRLPVRNSLAYRVWEYEGDSWQQGIEPHRGAEWRPGETLVAVKLPAGEHVFELSANAPVEKEFLRFTCQPGDVTYLVINLMINASNDGSFKKDWQIDRTDTMPEHFARWPLVLLDDGQWYIDAEPSK